MTDGTTPLTTALDEVERVLRDEHDRLLTVVGQCADAVVAEWDGDSVADRDRVVPPFARALDGSGALSRLPRALADAVTATGRPMPAPPVAAPPYVVVTGEGVVLRATVGDERLVILLRTFDVTSDESERYVRTEDVSIEIEVC
ncbi:hypothetical protein GJR96_11480 [Haloferax sp. MBLA0076]|uniref:DUF7988 domain-containing protein n=1 Tax=Haloferax litoreum TaxID=2666140 RepID=A0A6A8GJC5_9EURY|nr:MULTISPECIES: hypothetical protein [Haloferax]KAB1194023.1 hypothetical protein Hfx1148_11430 [Haloferax sp. CBA1148]MRX22572.1 hypothetical protein [Haloferax litoreum]